jgi:hypothetical protein
MNDERTRVFLVEAADLANDPYADVESVWDTREAAEARAAQLPHAFVTVMFLNEPEGWDV